ncbi:MAG: molybdopterin-dependent oxidoreductase [Planctomycetes bacterium]|nr:molybdopterin-dependent oxidoreductase [Planctomycetota bacterium]
MSNKKRKVVEPDSPAPVCTIHRMVKHGEGFDRRKFMKMAAGTGVAVAATSLLPEEFIEAQEVAKASAGAPKGIKLLQAACPYCGVGCGTLIKVENGKVVGMVPDKKHPTNRGIQCIKGLNAHEPIYRDRLGKVLVRRDMSDALRGHISGSKGRFDDDVFREVSYEEAEEIVAQKIVEIVKKNGPNAVGLNGSGQLTMEAQCIENLLMKGVIGSNSIEANARMCMTSAVTGYFHSYGSDAPPTSYEDIEEADFITFWGHNAREAHPILFWRVADHKRKRDIPTSVADPRRTGTVIGLEDINPRNSYHIPTLNGDISYLNAIAHVLMKRYPQACISEEWLEKNTVDWKEYKEGVMQRYSPQQVVERLARIDQGRVTGETIGQDRGGDDHICAEFESLKSCLNHGGRRSLSNSRRDSQDVSPTSSSLDSGQTMGMMARTRARKFRMSVWITRLPSKLRKSGSFPGRTGSCRTCLPYLDAQCRGD